MVDVSTKLPTRRQARVEAVVRMSTAAFEALSRQALAKGDALVVAQLAGMQAAKRTAELIPLCHSLPLEHIAVTLHPDARTHTVRVVAQAVTTAKTGIEMEAFTAAAVAALALYDMIKAVDAAAVIADLRLLAKTGGKQRFERMEEKHPCAQPS
jgi:cyclic pyranopterin phosphate synthase